MDTKHCRASADHQRFEMAMVVVVEAVDTRFALAQEPAVKLQKKRNAIWWIDTLNNSPNIVVHKKVNQLELANEVQNYTRKKQRL